jgi:uncharacterized protein (DUF1501 family)
MLNLETDRGVRSCDGFTRRDFLRVGSAAVGLSLAELTQLARLGAAPRSSEKACIQLFLIGGPSQLDTWDPKPNAPNAIRGPFKPIRTNVPGIQICEHFPLMAKRADRYAILRSVHHKEAPIHETGHQLLQTGRVHRDGIEWPHFGAVMNSLEPSHGDMRRWVLLPSQIANTGVSISHGQGAGFLDAKHEPFVASAAMMPKRVSVASLAPDPARLDSRAGLIHSVDSAQSRVELTRDVAELGGDNEEAFATILNSRAKAAFDIEAETDSTRARYGQNTFGQSCLLARRLIQHGVRLVTVNMFDTVFNQVTWDCHANGSDLKTTLDDYRDILCPMFDAAYTALLDDLEDMGLLDSTLVVAMGEFGRTPKLNFRGGRDHWPGVWSTLMAGGGVRGGRLIGESDKHAEEPKDRPIHAAEIVASVYHALNIDLNTRLQGPDGRLLPLVDAKPVTELF